MTRRLPAGNLPTDIASFVGRRRESSEIRRLLSATRLLTLTGVGGVGKTRLALRVAGQVRRSFADGVWLVELAALQDPALLPELMGRGLRAASQSAGDPVEALAEFLADRQLLLVVDNCEHLLPAVAQLIVELLRAAPGLRVLTTSREALEVPGEHRFAVAPLPVPPGRPLHASAAVGSAAVTLFAERAAAVQPGFTVTDDNAALVAGVCRRLDGIPLAIELAAAKLPSLSLTEVAQRLDDRFRLLTTGNRAALPRHQTLRAAVEWSFELCTKPERLLWMRASVFAGSFELAAAERVCGGDGLSEREVLEALTGLIGKSVLVVDNGVDGRRYRLLETLGRYGRERLRDPAAAHHRHGVDEAVLLIRHRDFYLEVAERFHADWFGPRQAEWSRRMRADLANLRTALGFCLATADQVHAGTRLSGALHYLWYGCGQAREGRLWLERMLAADPQPSPVRLRALAAHMRLLLLQGSHQAAAAVARQCLDLAERFDEPAHAADAVAILGIDHLYRNDLAAAMPLLAEATARAADAGPTHPEVAYANVLLALGLLVSGDPRRAGERLAVSRAVCQAHGDQWYLGLVQFTSAMQALAIPDLAQATAHGRESLRLRQALHDCYGAGNALELLAWVAGANHDHLRAARLLGAADQLRRTVGGSPLVDGQLDRRRETAAAARTALGEAAFDAEIAHGGDLGLDDAVAYALGHEAAVADSHPPPGEPDEPRLTRRERDVAELVARGLSNRQIAATLVISPRTAESHVENLLTKFGFTSRGQITAWYLKRHDLRASPGQPEPG